jgi:hypothetical protein
MLIETDTLIIIVVFILIGLAIFIIFAKSMHVEQLNQRVEIINQILNSDSVNPLITNPLNSNPIGNFV